ncbi:hypothetical protein [Gracilibacillus sp. JCM 18860]|uniref:hypothetical protein n=1 Tax=Gracilibacillus sp. JCM 18860 TaxID=1306159 RepID=UPI0032607D6E
MKEEDGVYTITSFAAFPKEIKFYHMEMDDIEVQKGMNKVSIKKWNNTWQQVMNT